ncbi:ABC transporter permease [Kribbella capetownensis]|uniref:ABC transporter permease n=1 Tax=Kribbella capetownensis TaxID=1572659 RepID=A0A4R0JFY4_9ACTN|nr:ABC transporter permease [Kribbella capetownensis]TCC45883.1 ABC transporter permease [Kribbella capetownensis]
MGKLDLRRIALALAAPVLAIVVALVITCLILLAAGSSVSGFLSTIFSVPAERNVINILNNASILYLSGLAAAIGFRMNLFNIGVEGQYQMAVFTAAVFAAQGWLPGPINVIVSIILAMLVGAIWASIAGVLKVTRGVSEVISTIMLNAIAVSLTAYMLRKVGVSTGSNLATEEIPRDSWVGGIKLLSGAPNELLGLSLLAVLGGIGYAILLNRSKFGFALRATGTSASAAVASGIDVRRMVVVSLMISGAVAGLIGLPLLFGNSHSYGTTFQAGIGFAGIAVALLGRNNPIGIAFGALLFSYLTEQSNLLEINAQVSPDIVAISQGVIVLAVVIAYEVVRRYRNALEQRQVAAELSTSAPSEATPEATR